jgi:hypothetical protein
MRYAAHALAIAVLLPFSPLPAHAVATTGGLLGVVTDASEQPLAGVAVTVSSPALIGGPKVAVTDASGSFNFPALPPGIYDAKAELDGFAAQEIAGVQVRLDRTATVLVTLATAEFGEAVTVTSELPLVDPTQASVGQVYDQQYLRDLPIGSTGRDYLAVLETAPGSVTGGNPNVFGSLNSENAYYIDGTDTTDPVTTTFGTNFNYDAIAEISYITAGYEAEYGRAIGGVVNLITKSGGNTFSGAFDARYQSGSFQESGDHFDAESQQSKNVVPSASLGGPIVRDRLWFFGSYQDVSTSVSPFGSSSARDFEGQNYIGKLTWRLGERWDAVLKGSSDPADIANSNAHVSVAPDATSLQTQGGTIYQAELAGVLTPDLLLDVGFGLVRSDLDVVPQDGDLSVPGHTDFNTAETYGAYGFRQYSERSRDELRAALTWLGKGLGTHEIKGGIEQSDMAFDFESNYNGEATFQDIDHLPFLMIVSPTTPNNRFEGRLRSAYLQDAWRPRADLTLRLGVRYDTVAYDNDAGKEIADLDEIQPRLGFAWDLSDSARTVLRGSWGRFMHPASVGLPYVARERSAPQDYYLSCSAFVGSRQDCIDAFGADQVIDDPVGFEPEGWFFLQRFASTPTTIQPGLEPTYADQWNIGVQHQFGARTVADLSYLEKRTRDIFEDTCIGNVPEPSASADCSSYTVANLAGLARDYHGVVLEVRSQARGWLNLRGNYVYASSRGNVGNTQYAGVDFDILPDHFVNTYGYLEDQARHRLRVDAHARLPLDFGLSVSGRYASEFRYDALRALASYGDEFVEPRGSRSGNEVYDFDLQASKALRLGPARIDFLVAIANVLDREQVIERCDRVDGCSATIGFTEPESYSLPRRYEAGLRVEF